MLVSRTLTKSLESWTALAPAKLNLSLEVLGKRDDGFHELKTLMVPVRLFDTLSWTPAASKESTTFRFRLTNSTSCDTPADEANLVVRAVELLASEAGIAPQGVFTLTKRIPTQAGMGGGSSDAAAALMLANRAWGLNYPNQRLTRLAAKLGSDVPFFLVGGPAVCQGRGEKTNAVPGLPKLHFVVIKPTESVPTSEAFAALQAQPYRGAQTNETESLTQQLIHALRNRGLGSAAVAMRNSFQEVICNLQPRLRELLSSLRKIPPWGGMMTGSGSAFFCLCRSAKHANHVAGKLRSSLDWDYRHWGYQENNRGIISETAFGGKHDRTHGTVWTTSTCH